MKSDQSVCLRVRNTFIELNVCGTPKHCAPRTTPACFAPNMRKPFTYASLSTASPGSCRIGTNGLWHKVRSPQLSPMFRKYKPKPLKFSSNSSRMSMMSIRENASENDEEDGAFGSSTASIMDEDYFYRSVSPPKKRAYATECIQKNLTDFIYPTSPETTDINHGENKGQNRPQRDSADYPHDEDLKKVHDHTNDEETGLFTKLRRSVSEHTPYISRNGRNWDSDYWRPAQTTVQQPKTTALPLTRSQSGMSEIERLRERGANSLYHPARFTENVKNQWNRTNDFMQCGDKWSEIGKWRSVEFVRPRHMCMNSGVQPPPPPPQSPPRTLLSPLEHPTDIPPPISSPTLPRSFHRETHHSWENNNSFANEEEYVHDENFSPLDTPTFVTFQVEVPTTPVVVGVVSISTAPIRGVAPPPAPAPNSEDTSDIAGEEKEKSQGNDVSVSSDQTKDDEEQDDECNEEDEMKENCQALFNAAMVSKNPRALKAMLLYARRSLSTDEYNDLVHESSAFCRLQKYLQDKRIAKAAEKTAVDAALAAEANTEADKDSESERSSDDEETECGTKDEDEHEETHMKAQKPIVEKNIKKDASNAIEIAAPSVPSKKSAKKEAKKEARKERALQRKQELLGEGAREKDALINHDDDAEVSKDNAHGKTDEEIEVTVCNKANVVTVGSSAAQGVVSSKENVCPKTNSAQRARKMEKSSSSAQKGVKETSFHTDKQSQSSSVQAKNGSKVWVVREKTSEDGLTWAERLKQSK